MRDHDAPVIVLGAGATKASGGPMTGEVLPALFAGKATPDAPLAELDRFLVDVFAVPAARRKRTADHFPPLPLLLSLVDTAIDRKEPIALGWNVAALVGIRRAIEYGIYRVLDRSLRRVPLHNPHRALFERVRARWNVLPTVISLNYDLIADNTLIGLAENFPDFGCDIATPAYRAHQGTNLLLKLHGSLGWMYCPACRVIELALSDSGRHLLKRFPAGTALKKTLRPEPCPACSAPMESIMITPTYRKDYRNPHVSRIWFEAERALRRAKRVVFVGYSLPEDDVEVIYLLKRGLHGLPAKNVTVVERASASGRHADVRRRYQQLFGAAVDWHENGFEEWLKNAP